jgi:transposase InsO family protein
VDKGRFLIETHLRTGRPLAELAKAHGVHRSWLYKLHARYRREGLTGLEARSRRPHRSPARVSDVYEDDVVAIRKELSDLGVDAGAETIRVHLARRRPDVPSVSTIWRILKARGFVTPQPHKRPKSSWIRFQADLPNERWQSDMTHVPGADGLVFEVLKMIDDHSRLCVSSRAFVVVRAPDVVRTLHRAGQKWGYPAEFLELTGSEFINAHLFDYCIANKLTFTRSRPFNKNDGAHVEQKNWTHVRELVGYLRFDRRSPTSGSLPCVVPSRAPSPGRSRPRC